MNRKPNRALQGLYAITSSQLLSDDQSLLHGVGAAIQGGARIVQYRDKSTDSKKRLRQSSKLLQLCRKLHTPLLINDDVALAAKIGADGVHIGLTDAALSEARAALGKQAIIGISCYNRLDLAEQAQQAGADYIAFGRFFSSKTKPEASLADQMLLNQARQKIELPIVAIGGITPQNGAPLISAGADMLAVIHGLFSQLDIQASASNYKQLFSE